MVAWVVIDRRHHRQAAPFALPLSTPLLPLPHLSPLFPVVYALFCSFLHLPKNQSFSFHALPHSFTKNEGWSYFQQMLFPDPKFFRIRISQIED